MSAFSRWALLSLHPRAGGRGKRACTATCPPHTFRHTLASRLLAATSNLRLVQQAMGHRSIASTLRYTHVPSEIQKAALEAV